MVPPLPEGPLSAEDARVLTDRICAAARYIADQIARLRVLVEQARAGQAWVALGYASWTAYLADTLEPMRLPREERREVVGYLSEQGMSTRAIAPIVSADPKAVVNDRRVIAALPGVESSTPAPTVTGLDGRQYEGAPARPCLVVVPEPSSSHTEQERNVRHTAARALHIARGDQVHSLLHPGAWPWRASATFEQARNVVARWATRDLAEGRDGLAWVEATAFVLLELRGRDAFTRTAEIERLTSPIVTTKVG